MAVWFTATKVAGFGFPARQVTSIHIDRQGRTIDMAFLKNATIIAALAGAGVVGMAGVASAADNGWAGGAEHHKVGDSTGDNSVRQGGIIPINTLNNVNVSPNLGCLAHYTLPDLNYNNILLPPGGSVANLNHLLEHTHLNVLSNGNIDTDVYDYSCTSNQGSSQAGNNSRGSVGAGDSSNVHATGAGAGSQNDGAGAGAGGLLGSSGVFGRGGLDL